MQVDFSRRTAHQCDSTQRFTHSLRDLDIIIKLLLASHHVTGHFGDKSFQAINCTGTDKETKHHIAYILNTKQKQQKLP